jgi:hypothetical protein
MCFQAAIANGSNMLLLIPEKEIHINDELEASVSQLLSESDSQEQIPCRREAPAPNFVYREDHTEGTRIESARL